MAHQEERLQRGVRSGPLEGETPGVDLSELERLVRLGEGLLEVLVEGCELVPSVVLADVRHAIVRLGLDLSGEQNGRNQSVSWLMREKRAGETYLDSPREPVNSLSLELGRL